MSAINTIEVEVTVTEPFTAEDYLGIEFTVDKVWWRARRTYTSVDLHGYTADGTRTNTTRFPDQHDVSQVPHPGLWFDELAKQITGGA